MTQARKLNKPDSLPSLVTSDTTLFATLRNQLGTIQAHQARSMITLRSTNGLQIVLQNEAEPLVTLQPRLEKAYENVREEAREEEGVIQSALETIQALIASKEAPQPPPPEPTPSAEKRNGKKRRLDGLSTGSPAPESPLSTPGIATAGLTAPPLSAVNSTGQLSAVPPALQTSVSSATSPRPTPAGGRASPGPPTPGVRTKPPRVASREAQLYDGRPVAFKTPPVKGTKQVKDASRKRGGGDQDVESGTWIMAKVLRCIDREKNKYEVQDIDEEAGPATLYTSAIKSIIPLPDPNNREATYPAQHYRVGADVLALYTETTSLYRGRVKEMPTARTPVYKVVFDGDHGQVHDVETDKIVEWSATGSL